MDRRSFLRGSALTAAGLTVAGPFQALAAKAAGAQTVGQNARAERTFSADYGPLSPVKDEATGLELLMLPAGFRYISHGWTRDVMSDGFWTPGAHDGMGAFAYGSLTHIVRNHERGGDTGAFIQNAYDSAATGGTTNMIFDPGAGEWRNTWATLSGTIRNCAGGITPWRTWMTCEESTIQQSAAAGTFELTKRHGYVFEVDPAGMGNPAPIMGIGRASWEAASVDPATGYVYITEDANPSCLTRFRPNVYGDLHSGGVLEAMVITSARNQANFDAATGSFNTRIGQLTGDEYDTAWVTIDNPNPDLAAGQARQAAQGVAKGAAAFIRLEGCWEGNGSVYFTTTSGGNATQGQVFAYEFATGKLTLLYESADAQALNNPDNITVSPSGALVLCEDGSGLEYLQGLTLDGEIFRLAQNNAILPADVAAARGYSATDYTGSEWAGAVFDPGGQWLFANIQSPGITFAITGPWENGGL